MSRLELTKELGVSKDKITRFLKNGMHVLVKGENGQPDRFSPMRVQMVVVCKSQEPETIDIKGMQGRRLLR